jgi:hypothetical protein
MLLRVPPRRTPQRLFLLYSLHVKSQAKYVTATLQFRVNLRVRRERPVCLRSRTGFDDVGPGQPFRGCHSLATML